MSAILRVLHVSIEPSVEVSYVRLRIEAEIVNGCHIETKELPHDHFQPLFRICLEECAQRMEAHFKLRPQ